METVLIDRREKPRVKRSQATTATKRAILPPSPVFAPRGSSRPSPNRSLRRRRSRASGRSADRPTPAPAEEEGEPQKIIHIKPPIVVKDLALQLGLKNFQLIKELMTTSTFSRADRPDGRTGCR